MRFHHLREERMNARTLACLSGLALSLGSAHAQPFALVALPDTQFYSEQPALFPQFLAQTNWVAARRAALNVAFVSHLGDIVQNGANGGNDAEWLRADQAMDVLDGVLPYAAAIGNHDYNTVSLKTSSSVYNRFFGPARYAGRPWYVGSSPDGENHAQRFTAGGRTWLHLSVEWVPDTAALNWARSVVDANPGLPVIFSTHEHVQDGDGSGLGAGRSLVGQNTWDAFIRSTPRVFMTLNGHFHRGPNGFDGEYHLQSVNDAGLPVFEMLSDYQSWASGGTGYLRLVRVDERNHLVTVRSFSPVTGLYQLDANSQLRFPLDFAARFDGSTTPALRTLRFRQGVNGYAGAVDTQLTSATPDTPAGGATGISVDASSGTPAGPTHGLIRFDGVIGPGAGQIGADTDVISAKLRLSVFDAGSGMGARRMIADWSGASTWNTLGAGVAPDGLEAVAYPDATAGGNTSSVAVPLAPLELDVTASVRAWLNGETNRGWALLPFSAGTNGVDFSSSEAAVNTRPELVVTLPTGAVRRAEFREGLDGYAGTLDTTLRQAAPSTPAGDDPLLLIDGDEPNGTGNDAQALIRFDGLFGPGRVPVDATITSAVLVMNVSDEGSGFRVHTVSAAWDEASTWDSLNAGVSADDAESDIYPEPAAGADSASASVRGGRLVLDVTDSVQQWQAGRANLGWVLRPFAAGSNGVRISSSESAAPGERPTLIVRFVGGSCPGDWNGDGVIDFNDLLEYLNDYNAQLPRADINQDGIVDFNDLLEFLNLYNLPC
jgi:hypothetical protein